MNRSPRQPSIVPFVLIGIVAIGLLIYGNAKPNDPKTPENDPGAPDMVSVFAQNDNRQEAVANALAMAAISDSVANILEYDGTLQPPKYTNGVEFDDLRLLIRKYRMAGWSFASKYPQLPSTLESYFAAQVATGTDASGKPVTGGGPVTAEMRKKWIAAHRQVAKSCRYAASRG